jgi:hypothetical protein
MANNLNSNPIYLDSTTGATWSGDKNVLLFQWVDDNADVAASDTCVFTVNGVTLTIAPQIEVTANYGALGPVIYQIGPFTRGVPWTDFTLSAIGHGAVHIWVE